MNELLQRIETMYSGLSSREQVFVRVGALIAALLLLIGLPVQLHSKAQKASQRVLTKTADLAYVNSVIPILGSAPAPQDGVPLVSVVDTTTRDAGLSAELRGTEPAGSDALRARFEGASFEQLTNWIVHLGQDFGVSVQQATFEHTDSPGRVNASVVLVRR
jgi:type II secretory pathway component PulM